MRAPSTTPGTAILAAVLFTAGALPIVGAQSADEWRLPDAAGDQYYTTAGGQVVPVGANPATSHTSGPSTSRDRAMTPAAATTRSRRA